MKSKDKRKIDEVEERRKYIETQYNQEFLNDTQHRICCKLQYKELMHEHNPPINFFECKKCGRIITITKQQKNKEGEQK